MYKSNASAVLGRSARYMPCTLTDESSGKTYEINIKEPKLKIFRQLENLGEDSAVEDSIAAVAAILNSNKENIRISPEFVEENFTLDELAQFFDDFSSWLSSARENNPN